MTHPICPWMLKVFNSKARGVAEFPRYNNADIDRYMQMPRDPTLIDPKVETVP